MTLEPSALLRPGGKFGDFTVVEVLGAGGMGAVYRVRDPQTDGDLAVKVMYPAMETQEFKRRFIREAEIAMKIEHPNLLRVYAVGRDPETRFAYMVMDYACGGSLRERISERLLTNEHFTVREAIGVIRKIADALEAAAEAGVVHRDVKPDNILFDDTGEPVLADLGVAKVSNEESSTVLTMSNAIIGTPAYMAPEHMLDSHNADCRADIYSLGIVLWEMLAGERPNSEATQSELMAKAVRGERIPDIRTKRPNAPRYVVELLRRMCAPRPEHRFATPGEIVRFLDDWRDVEARRFRSFLVWTLSTTAVVLAVVIALGMRWIRDERRRSADEAAAAPAARADSPELEFSVPKGVE